MFKIKKSPTPPKQLASINQQVWHPYLSWNAQCHWIISTLHKGTQTSQLLF